MSIFAQGLDAIGAGLDAAFGFGGFDTGAGFENFFGGDVAGLVDNTSDWIGQNFNFGTGGLSGALGLGSGLLGGSGSSASHSSAVPRDIINTGQVRTAQDPLEKAGKLKGTLSVDPQQVWAQWAQRMHYTAKQQVG
jgi:hypothetical protein